MASPIQRLAKLSYKIFRNHSNEVITKETLCPIIHAIDEIKAEDVYFDPNEVIERDAALKHHAEVAPVTFMNVHQSRCFTMAVFVVKADGSLPLHDHPRMFGLLKVIYGSVHITSYSKVDQQILPEEGLPRTTRSFHKSIITVKKNEDIILTDSDNCCFLSPSEGNFHEIKAVTDVAAFLDILAPPYGGDRDCTYYKELSTASPSHDKDIRWLVEVPQPRTYWCDVLKYQGPPLIDGGSGES